MRYCQSSSLSKNFWWLSKPSVYHLSRRLKSFPTLFILPPVAPCLPFGFEESLKEGNFCFGLKEAFKEKKGLFGGNFWLGQTGFKNFQNSIFRFFFYSAIGWRVHRYPWFQNRSIDKTRADPDKQIQINCALLPTKIRR